METRATSSATAATATDPSHTSHTPATMAHIEDKQEVWYILVDLDNIPFGVPLLVNLGHNETILHLKMKIKEGDYKDELAHVNIVNMEVWKCKSFTLRGVKDGIDNLVGRLKLSNNEDSDGQQPVHWDLVIDLQLQQFEPLVVRVQRKAKRKHEGDYLEGTRLSKLACLEPSKANSVSVYETLQESQEDRILDDCPKPNLAIPPLPLLYSGFGEFHDFIINSAQNPNAFSEPGLETKVDQCVNAMCHLGYEKEKQANTQNIVHHIFAGPKRKFKYSVDNGTQATTDGHVSASHGGPLLIIEFKRQITFCE
ncbi:hypothetical protein F5888DRAFT_1798087 [Russula emetica]|nr:hypothetical protein F5888DRAFT_1798087 [Russula emetica]